MNEHSRKRGFLDVAAFAAENPTIRCVIDKVVVGPLLNEVCEQRLDLLDIGFGGWWAGNVMSSYSLGSSNLQEESQ